MSKFRSEKELEEEEILFLEDYRKNINKKRFL